MEDNASNNKHEKTESEIEEKNNYENSKTKRVKLKNEASQKTAKNSNFKLNFWQISTFVITALLILTVVYSFIGNTTGKVISEDIAAEKIINYAGSQGVKAELVGVNDKGSLYEVILSINGNEILTYISKDGNNFIPKIIPIKELLANESENHNSEPDIPKSNKPVVELFVMSHCPYGTQIEKGIIPVVNLLKDEIDFSVKFVSYAMHPSQGEVEEQLAQYCIQKEQEDKFLDYLTCFLDRGKREPCLTKAKIDYTKLNLCTKETDRQFNVLKNLNDKSSWVNGRFPKFEINNAENEKYRVQGSPTLVINGKQASSGRDSASLLNTICSAFNDIPEECDITLSSASPSPGFGYDETTASQSGGGCGV